MARRPLPEKLAALIRERDEGNRRAARALHDQIGPSLAAAGLHLELLRRDVAPAAEKAAEIQQILEDALERVRALSRELDPSPVERAGLTFALDRMVETARPRFSGKLRLISDCKVRIPLPVASALHRAAECAFDNALRHSGADAITVALRGRRSVRLEVRDNGAGFNAATARRRPTGVGLFLMDSLAGQAGFRVSIDAAFARLHRPGTIVTLHWAPEAPPR